MDQKIKCGTISSQHGDCKQKTNFRTGYPSELQCKDGWKAVSEYVKDLIVMDDRSVLDI